MFNARTWHRLCVSAYLAFPAFIAGIFLPDESPLFLLVIAAIGWGMLVALLGGFQGILLALGRLRMGCPNCNVKSPVRGGDHYGMWLDCPKCGEMQLTIGRLGRLRAAERVDVDDLPYEPGSPLRAPLRHPVAFAVIFLPVVGGVIVGSVIHRFEFAYLLIPGFWCYCVGGLIIEGIFSGRMGDNQGTAYRSKEPIRFWAKILIWSVFYLFAASAPIGVALQEKGKEADKNPAGISR